MLVVTANTKLDTVPLAIEDHPDADALAEARVAPLSSHSFSAAVNNPFDIKLVSLDVFDSTIEAFRLHDANKGWIVPYRAPAIEDDPSASRSNVSTTNHGIILPLITLVSAVYNHGPAMEPLISTTIRTLQTNPITTSPIATRIRRMLTRNTNQMKERIAAMMTMVLMVRLLMVILRSAS